MTTPWWAVRAWPPSLRTPRQALGPAPGTVQVLVDDTLFTGPALSARLE